MSTKTFSLKTSSFKCDFEYEKGNNFLYDIEGNVCAAEEEQNNLISYTMGYNLTIPALNNDLNY